jgi:peptidyl-prolyl cis-trans isomerase B (cyclophilin B)
VAGVVALTLYLSGGSDSDSDGDEAAVGSPGDCAAPPSTPSSPQQFSAAPDPSTAEAARWEATITTNCGEITVELYGDKAPQTVASFLFLAQEGYWDDSPCHRLTTGGIYVLQCGDPTGTGTGGPGYSFGVENAPESGTYPPGTLAMARTNDPNSNGGQFFVVYDQTRLPTEGGGYSVFGKVTGGMDVVQAVAQAGVEGGTSFDGPPAQPISILDIDVHRL